MAVFFESDVDLCRGYACLCASKHACKREPFPSFFLFLNFGGSLSSIFVLSSCAIAATVIPGTYHIFSDFGSVNI